MFLFLAGQCCYQGCKLTGKHQNRMQDSLPASQKKATDSHPEIVTYQTLMKIPLPADGKGTSSYGDNSLDQIQLEPPNYCLPLVWETKFFSAVRSFTSSRTSGNGTRISTLGSTATDSLPNSVTA